MKTDKSSPLDSLCSFKLKRGIAQNNLKRRDIVISALRCPYTFLKSALNITVYTRGVQDVMKTHS